MTDGADGGGATAVPEDVEQRRAQGYELYGGEESPVLDELRETVHLAPQNHHPRRRPLHHHRY